MTKQDIPECLGDKYEFTSNYRGDKLEDWTEFRCDTFTRFTRYTKPETKAYYLPGLLSGSDYSGTTVELSNFRCFKDQYKDQLGISIWTLFGGYSTFGIAIDWEKATDEMKETLQALDDYPVIDEGAMSQLECEQQDEAWDNYLASDFKRALGKKFTSEADELTLDEMEDSTLFALFRQAMEKTNTYYVHEDTQGPYVNIDRLIQGIDSLIPNKE